MLILNFRNNFLQKFLPKEIFSIRGVQALVPQIGVKAWAPFLFALKSNKLTTGQGVKVDQEWLTLNPLSQGSEEKQGESLWAGGGPKASH